MQHALILIQFFPTIGVIAFVDEHKALLRLFKEDFVKRTLRMHSMVSVWLDVCISILDGLCLSRGKINICHLYVIKVFYFESFKKIKMTLELITDTEKRRRKRKRK